MNNPELLPMGTIVSDALMARLREVYVLSWHGIHGYEHWLRVRANGLRLAEETGADVRVVAYFAMLHDIMRKNDGWDPQHGPRAAALARELHGPYIALDNAAFEHLTYACAHHTEGMVQAHVTVQTCWDADRLDLGRVGIIPDPDRLCTPAAKNVEIRQWAWRRSQKEH